MYVPLHSSHDRAVDPAPLPPLHTVLNASCSTVVMNQLEPKKKVQKKRALCTQLMFIDGSDGPALLSLVP